MAFNEVTLNKLSHIYEDKTKHVALAISVWLAEMTDQFTYGNCEIWNVM